MRAVTPLLPHRHEVDVGRPLVVNHDSRDDARREERGGSPRATGWQQPSRDLLVDLAPLLVTRDGSSVFSAVSMAALIAESFRSGQFELLDGRMFFPLNGTSRMACGSWKSGSQPTFGQMFGSFFGTLQYFVYMVAWVTETIRALMPILARSAATTLAVSDPGATLSPPSSPRGRCTSRRRSRRPSSSPSPWRRRPRSRGSGRG